MELLLSKKVTSTHNRGTIRKDKKQGKTKEVGRFLLHIGLTGATQDQLFNIALKDPGQSLNSKMLKTKNRHGK
jgi:hypothetical protein